ncbi:MFS general substrate transporter [Meira miltonrushii]|uniref:MFS general substrate transporter n=1 Tax=Meira miltonrushii TaxID=1280837 RepID=A0A316VLH5_9BASI|nr:MFS general substrate transporter [Meira miltonrushii]PWN38479.1 MFS general substrate transporter [Meira miltonrushii]
MTRQSDENERLLEANQTGSNYGSITRREDAGILKKTILCASLFTFFGIMWGHFSSQIPVTKENLGISDRHFGLLLLFDDLGAFIGQAIATRLPALLRSTLLTPLIGSCVVTAVGLSNLSRTPKQFGASTLASGILASFFDIAINIQIVTLGAITGRADAPFFHGLFSGGQLIGSGLGTLLTRLAVPFDLRVIGMMSTLAVIYLLHFPIVRVTGQIRIDEDENTASDETSHNTNDNQSTHRQTIRTQIIILAAVGFFSSICEGSLSEWAGIYLRQNLGTSFAVANSAAFAYSLGMTLARFVGTWAARRIGLKAVMLWGSLIAGVAMFVGLALNDQNAFLISLVFAAIGLANITPLSMAFLSSFDADKQAISVAKISLAQQIGFFGGPVVIGNVSGWVGLRLALTILPCSSLAIMAWTIPLDVSAR